MTCGIYILKFKGTTKVYVGLSVDIEARFRNHLHSLRTGKSPVKLQEAFQSFGLPEIEVICECSSSDLDRYEKEAIEIFDSINNGFNSRDGGATGGGIGVSGESNGRAKYDKEKYLGVFFDLLNSKLSYKDLSDKWGVSEQIVEHISTGVSHKTWLSLEYPEEYAKLENMVNNRRKLNIVCINTDTGEEEIISSIMEFSAKYSIPKSTVSGMVTGRYKYASNWVLKYPVPYTPNKHIVHTLKDTSTNEIYSFNNVLGFCREHNIEGKRKAFSKFLKGTDTHFMQWVKI
jgi:group I intron endonuclease